MSELVRQRHSSSSHDLGSHPPDRGAPSPGKHTLTSQLEGEPAPQSSAVQRVITQRANAATSDAQVHAAADRGTSGPAEPLPHLSTIQRLFGAHDVSRVEAHTGAAAHEGATAMGAEAFARGNQVAFAGTPSLHTAAHEAAHVVQQRSGVSLKGGVGQAGDAYEQHADAVADAVVRGESAEALLGQVAAGGAPATGVQRVIRNVATGRRITRFDNRPLTVDDARFLRDQIQRGVFTADADDLARIEAVLGPAAPAAAEARAEEPEERIKRPREDSEDEAEPVAGPSGPAAAPSAAASSQPVPGPAGPAPAAQAGPAGPAQPNEAAISPELDAWLAGDKHQTSYADDARVHKIQKGSKKDLACWNWALRGLEDAGGPPPGDFWGYVLDPSADKELPASMNAIPQLVHDQLAALTQRLAQAGIARGPFDLPRDHNAREQAAAAPIQHELCVALVQAHGFTVVGPEAAAATVVCQYIASEGAAVPEHWWIELPGGIVIQTVPGRPLEVGGTETKFHSVGGRFADSAPEYREVRVPVRALKGEHVAVLEAAMNAAVHRTRRRRRG